MSTSASKYLIYRVFGSPAWIRTTIHGSKGRCPTIRRPGIEAFQTVPRRNQLWVLVYLFQGVSRNAPARLPANMEAQKQRLSQAQLAYQSTVLRSLEEADDALTAYGREQERREHLQAGAQASRQGTQLANEIYGLADFLTVLDAQLQQLAIQDLCRVTPR